MVFDESGKKNVNMMIENIGTKENHDSKSCSS